MSVFTPNIIISDVTKIDEELLNKNNIKAMILDVDNTLTIHGSQELKEHISSWLKKMSELGIKLMIVSNNTEERIKPFAQKIGLDYVAMGLKPMTKGFSKAQRKFNLPIENIAVVGDQIYTDIVGGNLKGMFTILVEPFLIENNTFFKVKRKLEKVHINKYHRINNKNLK